MAERPPMRFRSRPVEVQAMCFDGLWGTAKPILTWMGDDAHAHWTRGSLIIPSSEGEMTASAGDWIIKDAAGNFYPCQPPAFEARYEEITDGSG